MFTLYFIVYIYHIIVYILCSIMYTFKLLCNLTIIQVWDASLSAFFDETGQDWQRKRGWEKHKSCRKTHAHCNILHWVWGKSHSLIISFNHKKPLNWQISADLEKGSLRPSQPSQIWTFGQRGLISALLIMDTVRSNRFLQEQGLVFLWQFTTCLDHALTLNQGFFALRKWKDARTRQGKCQGRSTKKNS